MYRFELFDLVKTFKQWIHRYCKWFSMSASNRCSSSECLYKQWFVEYRYYRNIAFVMLIETNRNGNRSHRRSRRTDVNECSFSLLIDCRQWEMSRCIRHSFAVHFDSDEMRKITSKLLLLLLIAIDIIHIYPISLCFVANIYRFDEYFRRFRHW